MNTRKRLFLLMGLFLILAIVAAFKENTLAMGRDGTRITVTQTATAVWEQAFLWSVNQSVTPEAWFLFQGDTATTRYTIDVVREGQQETFSVKGNITVNNTGAVSTQGLQIENCVQYRVGSSNFQNLHCAAVDLGSNASIPARSSRVYPYEITFSPIPGAHYRNVATVSITNATGHISQPFAKIAKAGFTLPTSPTKTINSAVTVVDSNGRSWTFSKSGTQTYDVVLDCAGLTYVDEQASYTRVNTAVITQTGQTAETLLPVNCYQLRLTSHASGGSMYDMDTTWTIDKTADTSELNLEVGKQALVNYEITVDVAKFTYWIYIQNPFTVHNPNPQRQAVLTNLIVGGDVGCYKPYVVAPGGWLDCYYRADQYGTNTFLVIVQAKAVIQNYNLAPDGSVMPAGTTAFETEFVGDVSGDPHAGGCAWVNDSLAGEFEEVCWWSEPVANTITYSWSVGPYDACGVYEVENIASVSGTENAAHWTIQVIVPCPSD